MIIHQLEKEDFTSLIKEGWKFVDNSGSIKEKPSINNKIIVAIKDLAKLIQ